MPPTDRFLRVCPTHLEELLWGEPDRGFLEPNPRCPRGCRLEEWLVYDSVRRRLIRDERGEVVKGTMLDEDESTEPAPPTRSSLPCPSCSYPLDFLGHCKYSCKRCGWLEGCSEGIGL